MKLFNSTYEVICSQGCKKIRTNIFGGIWKSNTSIGIYCLSEKEASKALSIYRVLLRKDLSNAIKFNRINAILYPLDLHLDLNDASCEDNLKAEPENKLNKEDVEKGIQNLMNFFTEFDFEPNFRFINTFAYACNASRKNAINYIKNYFELTDSPMINQLTEKMKSEEFNQILNGFTGVEPNHKVNSRLKIYYGSAGTGKTTEALREAGNRCMVCHSAMLPSDLMEDFKFEDGKATFIPSALQNAIANGEIIVLDEINLLPFESLRFLQSILDGKKEFEYKGKTIEIKDGFKIIGTMNLRVNGSAYCLPEPLVDRCEEIKKFNLTAKNLLGAII